MKKGKALRSVKERKDRNVKLFSLGYGIISAELHYSQDQREKPSSGFDEGNSDITVECNGMGESSDLL